jgi:hypothetical protein
MLAGYYRDPLLDRTSCLILDPGDLSGTDEILGFARVSYPDASVCLLRVDALESDLESFEDYLYYVRLDQDPVLSEEDPRISVRSATPEDRDFLVALLHEAFDDALKLREGQAPDGLAEQQAGAILDLEPSTSLIAEVDGAPIGHVTLLDDQVDEVTAEPFVEFLDMLVLPGHEARRAAQAELIRHARDFAVGRELPLLGHVVVRPGGQDYDQVLLDRLQRQGWQFSHKFLIAQLT